MDMGPRLLILDNVGHLTECILQLAFYDATPASNAVLYSLLGLSSLNLGRTGTAFIYKIKALSYLQQSLQLGNVGPRTVQHLMASMLLYLCEVRGPYLDEKRKLEKKKSRLLTVDSNRPFKSLAAPKNGPNISVAPNKSLPPVF